MLLRLSLHSAGGIHGVGSSGKRGEDDLNRAKCQEEGKAKHQRTIATTAVEGRPQKCYSGFQMPVHYPRYKREDYEKMEGWKIDVLLREYGLSFDGPLHDKRAYAMGTFLWPDQL